MIKRTDKIIRFLKEIDKLKLVEREPYCSDLKTREDDACHSWHLAMFLILFQKDLPKDLDSERMLKIALIHDLVEIYAGDTFAFDKVNKKTQKKRELAAAKKLFSQLPDDLNKDLSGLFREFEEVKTPEAKMVQSFDKIAPMLQNLICNGMAWKKHGIKYKDIDDYKRHLMTHNDLIYKIYRGFLEEAKERKLI